MASDDLDPRATRAPRPVHLHWQFLVLVAAGGALGTTAREALTLAIPPLGTIPLPTFLINIAGALLLGVLLESLVRRGHDEGRRRYIRLFLGTGVLGGFTTYSSLATDTALRLASSEVGAGLLYAAATLLVGALATWIGIAGASALHRRSVRRRSDRAVNGT